MPAFGPSTTTDEVLAGIDLGGRSFVITGASSGLGEETSRALASKGASVTMVARNREKLDAAARRIRQRAPDAKLELHTADLADLESVRRFTDAYRASHPAIDVLVNNAGVMCCPFARTADGFEMQFGTNHLGHFLLTSRLMPALLRGDRPRVVNLSSGGHAISDVDLDDPNFDSTEYDPWIAYGRAKTANALFTAELARRFDARGVLAFAVHPGMIMTELGRHLTEETINQMFARQRERAEQAGEEPGASPGGGMPLKPVEAGAATQVWAATAPELGAHNGSYLADCQLGVEGENPTHRGYAPHALDPTTAARLWALSERLVGEPFAA